MMNLYFKSIIKESGVKWTQNPFSPQKQKSNKVDPRISLILLHRGVHILFTNSSITTSVSLIAHNCKKYIFTASEKKSTLSDKFIFRK